MGKKFWPILGIVVVIVVIAVAAIWFTNHKKTATVHADASPTNHVQGSTKTGVKLVEYCDYASPSCWQYNYILHQINDMYGNQIQSQFRNLPLTQTRNAHAAAQAAEAAALQGKFWEMHDTLYFNQNSWGSKADATSDFNFYAGAIGMNKLQFEADYLSDNVNNQIRADADAFHKTGVKTIGPTFFLDGQQIQPTADLASFETDINAAIKQKGFTPAPNPLPTPRSAAGSTTPTDAR